MTGLFPRARDPDLFPPSVALCSVTIPAGAALPAALATEALPAALERAPLHRKLQFLAGRACASGAIEQLAPGASPGALPRDDDGCPVWPRGIVGSIAHSDAFAVAAVARTSEARGLGVDVEPVMSGAVAAELAGLVASEEEARRAAEAAGFSPSKAMTLVFSAKESLYKALYPSTRKPFGYRDCVVARLEPLERRFVVRFNAPFDLVFGAPEFAGRYEFASGAVCTGVLVPSDKAGSSGLIRAAL